ncbi:MAG: InlB B-repeat-containing protein [Anaerovoracaceae bacterium]|jgi:uncharacterized repeat protein (TIGR02543 family)
MKFLEKILAFFRRTQLGRKRWYKVVTALAAVVVFATTYAMVLPALTLDQNNAAKVDGLNLGTASVEQTASSESSDLTALDDEDNIVLKASVNSPNAAAPKATVPQLSQIQKNIDKTNDGGTKEAAVNTPNKSNTNIESKDASEENTGIHRSDAPADADQNTENDKYTSGTLTAKGSTYTVTLNYGKDAEIPEDAILTVKELTKGSDAYQEYYEKACDALKAGSNISFARFFDVEITSDGKKIEPSASVDVQITYSDPVALAGSEKINAVHFVKDGDKETPEVLSVDTNYKKGTNDLASVSFKQDSFSIIGTVASYGSWPATDGSDHGYVIVMTNDNNDYYALKHDGTLTPVTYDATRKSVTFGANIANVNAVEADYYWYVQKNQMGNNGIQTAILYYTASNSTKVYLDPSSQTGTISSTTAPVITSESGTWSGSKLYTMETNIYGGTKYFLGFTGTQLKGGITSKSNAADVIFADDFDTSVSVSFDSNGGSAVATQSIKKGSKADKPADPTRDGYYFMGWYSDSELTTPFDFNSTSIENDTTLYAKWKKKSGNQEEQDQDDTILDKPVAHKKLTAHKGKATDPDQSDGTYDLTLSVTGDSKVINKEQKADVLIIFDNSQSMDEQDTNAGKKKIEAGKETINALADKFKAFNSEHPDAVSLSLITYGTHARIREYNQTDIDKFKTVVNSCEIEGEHLVCFGGRTFTDDAGTNWENALRKANQIEHRSGANQYVIFVSDGNPTFRLTTDLSTDNNKYYSLDNSRHLIVNDSPYNKNYVNGSSSDDLFGSGQDEENSSSWIGIPCGYYNGTTFETNGTVSITPEVNVERCYENARDEAKAIVDSGASFYTISTYGKNGSSQNINMQHILNYAYNESDTTETNTPDNHYFEEVDSSGISEAFNNIYNQITSKYVYSNVKIQDTLTNLTAYGVDGQLDGNQFVYKKVKYKKDGTVDTSVNLDLENGFVWDKSDPDNPVKYYPATCTNNSDGTTTITWQPIKNYNDSKDNGIGPTLEDGYSYEVTLRVWPKQEAYDQVAKKLNDSTSTIDNLISQQDISDFTAGVNDPNIGTEISDRRYYRLETNDSTATVEYQKTTINETSDSDPVVTPDPTIYKEYLETPDEIPDIPLTAKKITIEKTWNDGLTNKDRPESVTFYLIQDGDTAHPFATIKIKNPDKTNGTGKDTWKGTAYISPGLEATKTNTTTKVTLNSGHTYTITEDTQSGYQFEADSISGVKLSDSNVTISGGGDLTLTGTNTKTAELPESGGPGTLPYLLGGLLLTGAALIAGAASRRSKRKEVLK